MIKLRRFSWLTFAPIIFLGLWSGGYVVAKIALQHAEPMTILALRYGLVVLIMAVLFVLLRPPLPKRWVDWAHLAIVGFLIQVVYFGLCYLAFIDGISAGGMALILSLQPVLVALAAPAWSDERVSGKTWIGLALGLCGAVLVIYARSEIAGPSVRALVLAGFALLGICAGSLWEKKFGVEHHPVTSNLVGYSVGFIGVAPFMFWFESMQVSWNWEFGFSMFYLVIGNSVIAIGLLLAMIRAGDVGKVSALFFLVPPVAAILAWWTLGEIMPPLAWFGMVIAGVGVFIATRVKTEELAN